MATSTNNKQAENPPTRKGTLSKSPSPDDSLSNYADIEESDTDMEDTRSMMQEIPDSSEDKKPLSLQRRLCLLGSLMLCIFTVFAFAFLLPCHRGNCEKGKCKPKSFWSVNLPNAHPIMLKRIDGSNKQTDVVVGFAMTLSNSSNSSISSMVCGRSKNDCHSGVLALSSCDGHNAWHSSFNGSLALLVCQNQEKERNSLAGCLVLENQSKLHLLNPVSGKKKWTANEMGIVHSYRTIWDVDSDGIRDIVIVRDSPVTARAKGSRDYIIKLMGTISILSGKTGHQIGVSLTIPGHQNGSMVLLVHQVFSNKQFILVGTKKPTETTGTLMAIEVKDLANRARNWKRKSGISWGSHSPDPQSGFISLLVNSLVLTEPMIADLNNDGVFDIVLLTKEQEFTVRALNGKNVNLLWKRTLPTDTVDRAISASITLSKKLSHIGIMLKFTNHTSAVLVLNGHTGAIMWSFHMNQLLTVPPVGIPQMKGIPGGLLLWLPKSEILDYLNTTIVTSLEDAQERSFDSGLDNRHLREGEFGIQSGRVKRNLNGNDNIRKTIVKDAVKNLLMEMRDSNEYRNKRKYITEKMIEEFVKQRNYEKELLNRNYDDEDDDGDDDDRNKKLTLEQKISVIEKVKKVLLQEIRAAYMPGSDHSSNNEYSVYGTAKRSTRITPLQTFLNEWREKLRKRKTRNLKLSGTSALSSQSAHQDVVNVSTTSSPAETVSSTATSTKETPDLTSVNQSPVDATTASPSEPTSSFFDDNSNYNNYSLCQACGKDRPDASAILSVVILYKDGGKLRVKEIAEERPVFLEPEQYKRVFGNDLPSPMCVKLVPQITSPPVITNLDKITGKLDMVYTIDHVTAPCPGSNYLDIQPRHVMTIRKIDIPEAMKRAGKLRREGRDVTLEPGDETEGSGKRNEVFESPFSKWGVS